MEKKYRILIVDDNESTLERLKEFLEKKGIYKIDTCPDLKKFRGRMNRLEKRNYDLVILDILFPNGNGIDEIKAFKNQGISLPNVLFMSGNITPEIISQIKEVESSHYLQKNSGNEKLEKLVSDLVVQGREMKRAQILRKSNFLSKLDSYSIYNIIFESLNPFGDRQNMNPDELELVRESLEKRIEGIKDNTRIISSEIRGLLWGSVKNSELEVLSLSNNLDYLLSIMNHMPQHLVEKMSASHLEKESIAQPRHNVIDFSENIFRYLLSAKKYKLVVSNSCVPLMNEKYFDFLNMIAEERFRKQDDVTLDDPATYHNRILEMSRKNQARVAYFIKKNQGYILNSLYSRTKSLSNSTKKIIYSIAEKEADIRCFGEATPSDKETLMKICCGSHDVSGIKVVASRESQVSKLFEKCVKMFGTSNVYHLGTHEQSERSNSGYIHATRFYVKPKESPDYIEVRISDYKTLIEEEFSGPNAHPMYSVRRRNLYDNNWSEQQRKHFDNRVEGLLRSGAFLIS